MPTAPDKLEKHIEALFDAKPARYSSIDHQFFRNFKNELNAGRIRSAEPDASRISGWRTNEWVKKGILIGFRMGVVVDMSLDSTKQPFFDKDSYPVRHFTDADGVRIVPGGSSIRDGCYIARDVVCMPPMFVNAGAYVDEGTMIDSHALVGSCAQIGKNCHISAASQIGGVLEPVGAMPVIIEDEVLVGGNCGVYEGTIVKRRAVLGTGTILNRSTPVYDLVNSKVYMATDLNPLIIPEEAVVVAGARAVTHGIGKDWGICLYTPVIVKY
ncbi:MAG TPA: 2,3,4,5-tetrahydropyridine-2,6-dicarboxylate N-succinyltransferase, partial [Candidatus Acidoferrales bacterium]|nr:2,3,4,5-tetrahydropyridine-2,6-dicarboxylate N-succinyltransferase [Candidatus Acidoferrales bacterium]